MQGVALRKILISIFTITVVIITTFATTYAWVGILSASSIEQFKLNLKGNELSNYNLLISPTEDGEFTETVDEKGMLIIKKQILSNMGINVEMLTDQGIESEFNNIELAPVSIDKADLFNDEFYLIEKNSINVRKKTKKRFKFDLYLTVDYVGDDAITDATNIIVNLFLEEIEKTLVGTRKLGTVANGIKYPSNNAIPTNFNEIKSTDSFYVDSSSSTRVALSLYSPIPLEDSYQEHKEIIRPYKEVIYQGGSNNPIYDKTNNTYSFGGILPEEYNLAYQEFKSIYRLDSSKFYIPESALNRGDLELNRNNNLLADTDLGFGIINGKRTKMKITVDFWFEGWDADCFEIINRSPVTLNLVFSTAKDEK